MKVSMLEGQKKLYDAKWKQRVKRNDNQLKDVPDVFQYEYPEDKKGKVQEDAQDLPGNMSISESLTIHTNSDFDFKPQDEIITLIDGAVYNITSATPLRESAYNDRERRWGISNKTQVLVLDI